MTRVACIGEAMVELSVDPASQQAQVNVAGDTLNTAVYLKRSAPELEVSYITRLGQDAFSDRVRAFIASEALDTGSIEVSASRHVGLYAISTDETGERSFTYWRSQSSARDLFQVSGGLDFSGLDAFDVIYLSAITLAILPEDVRRAFVDWLDGYLGHVVFDSNYRPALWEGSSLARAHVAALWQRADFALPSVDDEMALFGDDDEFAVVDRLRALGVRDGALKCGAAGPVSLGAPILQSYPRKIEVVDSTAAGDSFNGGYLAARLTGAEQAEALMAGHRLAAEVVTHRGAISPRPTG